MQESEPGSDSTVEDEKSVEKEELDDEAEEEDVQQNLLEINLKDEAPIADGEDDNDPED